MILFFPQGLEMSSSPGPGRRKLSCCGQHQITLPLSTFFPNGPHFLFSTIGMSAEKDGIFVASLDHDGEPADSHRRGGFSISRHKTMMAICCSLQNGLWRSHRPQGFEPSGDLFPPNR